eukprot:CAMPEP_0116125170 /NCGR_PEP_ID=MMETSP0329-20121206/5666_1 /TAXON_ID=697910 /ORGANISM="Pseudo-nitzschia arenysensis, Strain B593" /LENGTH=311 /DNA_ID=CAMNT_0003619189 /DNA_START=335 /DNA_END=1270 /DNA_ORIENTATION=-
MDRAVFVCLVTIAVCVLQSDAFSTCSIAPTIRSQNADNNRRKNGNEHSNLLHPLSMVARIPTSNATLDETAYVENVNVENVDTYLDYDEQNEEETEDLSTMDTMEIKSHLLDLLPRMTGRPEEYHRVESYVNTLEDRYVPVQTLDFLNLAMSGEWQLIFSTNIGGPPRPNFRLRELYQKIESKGSNGTIVNEAAWDWAQDHEGSSMATSFDAHGTFSIKCSYSINQGARMVLDLNDHAINLSKGSTVPKDVEKLVALLYRAIPTELFDPSDHAMDTTYLDGDLRIVRMTGPKFEAVRGIFIRRGSVQINPV